MKGVSPLYEAFKKHLRTRQRAIAPLQLLGRLEDYLTKEFTSVIMIKSKNAVLPLINPGGKGESRRIDLALAEGDLARALDRPSLKRDLLTIRAFVELKYVWNRHRYGYWSADDETGETFKSLHRQLGFFDVKQYAGYRVRLRSRESCIYGVVFASYVRRDHEPDGSAEFVKKVREAGRKAGLRYQDEPNPRLLPIYENVPVTALRGTYLVSLYMGLWRPTLSKESATARTIAAASASS